MKSQVNRSPCASCFSSRSCARFSPTSSMPGLGQRGQVAVGDVLGRRRGSRRRGRSARAPARGCAGRCSGSIAHDDARLAAGHAAVAAVREVELRLAARAAVDVLDVASRPPPRASRRSRPAGRASARTRLRRCPRTPPAPRRRPRSSSRRCPGPTAAAGVASKRVERLLDDPAGERAPAAVEHRRPLAVRERDREAVGHEHEQPEARLARQVPVEPRQVLAAGLGVDAVGRRLAPLAELGAVHLPAHRHPVRARRPRAPRRGGGSP